MEILLCEHRCYESFKLSGPLLSFNFCNIRSHHHSYAHIHMEMAKTPQNNVVDNKDFIAVTYLSKHLGKVKMTK